MFKYSSRFWLYAPTALFLLLAAAVMIHWWIAAAAFEKRLAALNGNPAMPGIRLYWDKAEISGFPFRLDVSFTNFSAMCAAAHGTFYWKTDRLALHALTYGRRQTVYEAAGPQHLDWTDAAGKMQRANFLPGSLRASSVEDNRGLRRFDLDGVDLGSQDFTAGRKREFAIGRFQFHMRRDPGGSDLDLMVKIDTLQVRGAKAGNLQFYTALKQARPLYALLEGKTSWRSAAADWRAQGGTAALSQVTVSSDAIWTPQLVLSALY